MQVFQHDTSFCETVHTQAFRAHSLWNCLMNHKISNTSRITLFLNSGITVYKILNICFYHLFFSYLKDDDYKSIFLIKQVNVWNMKKEFCLTHWSIFADRSAFSVLATVYVVYYNLNFYPFLENHKNIKTEHYVKFQYSG